jgi:predicted DNA-binding transcriptional regulator AlpA
MTTPPRKLLRLPALRAKLGGVSTSTIYRSMRSEGFPLPIKLTRQVSLWDESEVDTWIQLAAQARQDLTRPDTT